MQLYGKAVYQRPTEAVESDRGVKLASAHPGRWAIKLDPDAMVMAKRLFTKVDKGDMGVMYLAHNPATARDLAWFFERYPVEIAPEDRVWLEGGKAEYVQQSTLLQQMQATGYKPPPVKGLALPAREYQLFAAALAHQTQALLLADSVGLGKTLSSIALLMYPDMLPAVVVTLTPLPRQWEREINRFAPHLRTHVIRNGGVYDLRKRPRSRKGERDPFPDVVITSFSKLTTWAPVLAKLGFQTLIGDEVHELRHPDTNRSRAWKHLRSTVSYCMGTTATPVFGMGSQMHSVIDAIKPGALGAWDEFVREWCAAGYDPSKPVVKDPDMLGAYLRREGLMLRRTREEVGRELPPMQRITQVVDVDDRPMSDLTSRATELAQLIMSATATPFQKMQAGSELDWQLRQATGIGKARHVAEFVDMLMASGEKVVLFGWHRAVYELWAEKLKEHRPAFYTGEETTRQKEAAVARFCDPKHPDPTKLLIISLRSGAGLDGLQYAGCRIVVFGELDWAPAQHIQDEGRVYRDGQPEHVIAYYLTAPSGSDLMILEALGLKADQSRGLLDPGAKPERTPKEQELALRNRIKAMAASYLESKGAAVLATLPGMPTLAPIQAVEPPPRDPYEAPTLPEHPAEPTPPVASPVARRGLRRGR